MQQIHDALAGLALGTPQTHRNLALFPLIADVNAPERYVLLDDALERGLARVTEISGEGSVPELAFENASAEKILLVDGDELIGAKQNRVLNISVLVGGGMKVAIPVSCVEQGRWSWRSRHFSAGENPLFAKARSRKMASVSASMREHLGYSANQGQVWKDVAEKMSSLRVKSGTMSMSDAYEARDVELRAFTEAFHVLPGQSGAVLAIDGAVTGLELFDSPAAFARYLRKLVRSYALDAIESAGKQTKVPVEAEVRRFLQAMADSAAERFRALGEGEDIRLSGAGITGGALAAEGRIVHLAGFVVEAG